MLGGVNKQGNAEQQAWVYAGMWTNNPAERELLMQNLVTSKQYDVQWAGPTSTKRRIKCSYKTCL